MKRRPELKASKLCVVRKGRPYEGLFDLWKRKQTKQEWAEKNIKRANSTVNPISALKSARNDLNWELWLHIDIFLLTFLPRQDPKHIVELGKERIKIRRKLQFESKSCTNWQKLQQNINRWEVPWKLERKQRSSPLLKTDKKATEMMQTKRSQANYAPLFKSVFAPCTLIRLTDLHAIFITATRTI